MGMDVYGRAPKSEEGGYFRSSIWGWPSILDAIASTSVLPEDLVEQMAYNSGAGPDAEQSIALADALDKYLDAVIADGEFISDDSKYAKVGTATVATQVLTMLEQQTEFTSVKAGESDSAQFSADVEFIREFARFCRDSGGFEVW